MRTDCREELLHENVAPPLWASAYDNDVSGLWRILATRREWSHRQATMHLVFAIGDPEVNNESDKIHRDIFLENFFGILSQRAFACPFVREVIT
jgi:hypothetical protein